MPADRNLLDSNEGGSDLPRPWGIALRGVRSIQNPKRLPPEGRLRQRAKTNQPIPMGGGGENCSVDYVRHRSRNLRAQEKQQCSVSGDSRPNIMQSWPCSGCPASRRPLILSLGRQGWRRFLTSVPATASTRASTIGSADAAGSSSSALHHRRGGFLAAEFERKRERLRALTTMPRHAGQDLPPPPPSTERVPAIGVL